jgi:hypothetical protein
MDRRTLFFAGAALGFMAPTQGAQAYQDTASERQVRSYELTFIQSLEPDDISLT